MHKFVPAMCLLVLPGAFAQTPALDAETLRIQSLVAQINTARQRSDGKAFAKLFTADGDLRNAAGFVATGNRALEKSFQDRAVWSETTPPVLADLRVRLVSPNVALVDATETRIGSVALKQKTAALLVVRRISGVWRVASYRVLANIPSAGPPV
jgi:uncharacterized protein (TIGR02246 family)